MIPMNLQYFASDGLLGKKLVLAIADNLGNVVAKTPEFLKWSEEEITSELKKNPLGEETEHRQVIQNGWKGSFEGEDTNGAYDDLVDKKIKYQEDTGGTLNFILFSTRTYKDGTVKKYRYENVTLDGYKASADDNSKPVKNQINWHATKRVLIQ